ncbi:succinylglutamate desuccinylase/aspartoacylase family protein [Pelagibius litoralis]|uniref:Succinylglutamate desuccinylase/aspartoacylase family protein n=1 Tax=Pelagibius litoralis TaxID=374515 RepID=A0A967EVL3_9PROT|nr:succinylglutamate desuccinylase/aspartoacylase family protein [Pelagibius litoralis]NIA68657.1 succinylglutamate desuccinylase/aspartoacylase family protein [Pelagibius litoralis]
MPRRTETLPLLTATPGTSRTLTVHRFGEAGARPKAYLQASLHADETPGLLVQHHLHRLLAAAEERGEIQGEVILVPYANPIGLAQFNNSVHLGRCEVGGGGNFNRNWPDLFTPIADGLADKLGGDAAANVTAIRKALSDHLAGQEAGSEMHSLRLALASLAADADLVWDLHCDDESLMHLFLIPAHWPQAADFAADLGCHAVLLADDSGGNSFDETFSTPWTRLAARYPQHPIPAACLSATVELRGTSDVNDELAAGDAQALFHSLQRFGVIAGETPPPPAPLCDATNLDATDSVRAPCGGVLAYAVQLGDRVEAGDTLAWIVDPAAEPDKARHPVVSQASGIVLSRRLHRYVRPGMAIAKVVGNTALPHRQDGYLLED